MKKLIMIVMLVAGITLGSVTAQALQIYRGSIVEFSDENNEIVVETNEGTRKTFLITDDTIFPGASAEKIKKGWQVIIEADGNNAIAVNRQRRGRVIVTN